MEFTTGHDMGKDPRLIKCSTECGNEKCYGKRYGLFAEKTCPNRVPPAHLTNGDKIRAMTDEELAKAFAAQCSGRVCPGIPFGGANECEKCWLDWLRREI